MTIEDVPYHVYIFELFDGATRRGRAFQFINLSEEQLQNRIIERWDRGQRISWSGRTVDSKRASNIRVFYTDDLAPPDLSDSDFQALMSTSEDRTNDWITGPAGTHASIASPEREESYSTLHGVSRKDARRIMVVHGRNLAARDAMFTFLGSLRLSPIEWEQAIAATGVGSPHNLDAVRAAMDIAQAVVVILTAEDQAGLLPDLSIEKDEALLRGQPRQNVILEAGLAMGVDRQRTILVELGAIRRASDFHGLNVVRLANDPESRADLRTRLRTAGCELDDSGGRWMSSPAGGDFEACVVAWQAHVPPDPRVASGSFEERNRNIQRMREAARLLRTELLDIRNEIDMFRKDTTIPNGFAFPASEWTEHRKLIASDPDLYSVLEDVYIRAHRVNEIVRWRRTVSTSRLIGVNWAADGLEEVDTSAQEAVSALEALIRENTAE